MIFVIAPTIAQFEFWEYNCRNEQEKCRRIDCDRDLSGYNGKSARMVVLNRHLLSTRQHELVHFAIHRGFTIEYVTT